MGFAAPMICRFAAQRLPVGPSRQRTRRSALPSRARFQQDAEFQQDFALLSFPNERHSGQHRGEEQKDRQRTHDEILLHYVATPRKKNREESSVVSPRDTLATRR